MNDKNPLFNRRIGIAILAIFTLSASVACARIIETGEENPSDYRENAIRRFEVVSLISLPFTAIHSYLIFRGVEMIRQGEFSPEISDDDYIIIGGMAVTFSVLIGLWDWYHTHGEDTSQPKIPTKKIGKEQYGRYDTWRRHDLSIKSDFLSATNDSVIVVRLYQMKF